MEELRAVVEEARAANRYVTGHAYTAAAINRGLEAGVGCIEHGNLMDRSSVELFQRTGAFYVPTLATYAALAEEGLEHGMPADQHAKVFEVLDAGLGALELAHRAGLPIAYGTDLLGGMHRRQLTELTLRSEVQPAADVLRSATTVAARLVGPGGPGRRGRPRRLRRPPGGRRQPPGAPGGPHRPRPHAPPGHGGGQVTPTA